MNTRQINAARRWMREKFGADRKSYWIWVWFRQHEKALRLGNTALAGRCMDNVIHELEQVGTRKLQQKGRE